MMPLTYEDKLRDHLIAQALTGILASAAHPASEGLVPANALAARTIAEAACTYADAVMIARQKPRS